MAKHTKQNITNNQKFVDQAADRKIGWILFLVLLFSTSYFFPRWADQNSNSRLDMVVAVVDDGTFQIDRYVKNTVDYAKVGEHYYSDKAPGAALLGIPVYASIRWLFDLPQFDRFVADLEESEAFQQTLRVDGSGVLAEKVRFAIAQVALTVTLASLPTALIGVLIFWIARRWVSNPIGRAGAGAAYALITPAFAYGQSFYGHQLCTLQVVSALALTMSQGPPFRIATWKLGLAGFMLSYAIITEYPAFLASAAVAGYIFFHLWQERKPWRVFWMAAPAALVFIGWMGYNWAIFGGPLSLGYSYSEQWVDQHSSGFMSLTYPTVEAAWGITFGSFRGLFFYSPIFLVGIVGFLAWWKEGEDRSLFWAALFCVVTTYIFNASSVMWWGGFAIGPRYMLTALPFLIFPLIFAARRWGNLFLFKISLGITVVWSIFATWGLTLAEQAFPSDLIRNPLFDYAMPNWAVGNIARNAGTLLGLTGINSLIPIIVVYLAAAVSIWMIAHFASLPRQAGIRGKSIQPILHD